MFEKIVLLQSFIITLSIIVLYSYELLTIESLFKMHCFLCVFCILAGILSLMIVNLKLLDLLVFEKVFVRYVKEFFSFSHPLLSMVFLFFSYKRSMVTSKIHGSLDQGYFTLALKLPAFCFYLVLRLSMFFQEIFS